MYIAIEADGDIRIGSEAKMSPEQLRRAVGGPLAVRTGPGHGGRRLAAVMKADGSGSRNLLATLAAHRFGIVPEDEVLRGTVLFAAECENKLLPLSTEESAAFGIILGVVGTRASSAAAV